ncbi:uncharacterized protein LOC143012005 [Genypterus blacodes]|uniref:uncharacterized protein LOC143012005 n=1 Tax=Genypterus blacodes TaxID=154954 RepID=UPI003F76DF2C
MPSTGEETRPFDLSAGLKPRERNDMRFTCIDPKKCNVSEFPALKECLPDSYDYHVCNYKTISDPGDHVNFRATLRMALSTEEEIKLWLKSHTVTWRVDRTDPGKGQKVIFKVDFRCQHKTRPRVIEKVSDRSKNTNCPAKMTVTLLHTQVSRGRQSRSTDPHLPTFPTIVTICSDHNHNFHVTDALRPRDMGDKTKGKLNKRPGDTETINQLLLDRTPASKPSMELELKNVALKMGDQLKVKGFILHDADRFQIDLGYDADDLALHFNPRFNDDDGAVLVCNSKTAGCWGDEQRETHNPLQRDTEVKIVMKLAGELFEVELPGGQEVQFPNRVDINVINYIRIRGDFKLTSFKIC